MAEGKTQIQFSYPVEPDAWMTQGYSAKHRAYDWGVVVGTPLYAMQSGVVSKVEALQKGYGLYIVLDHGDQIESLYAHLSEALLSEGDPVQLRQVIALSGNTGNSTGPHVHIEARYKGVAFDFLPLLSGKALGICEPERMEIVLPEFPRLPRIIVHVDDLRLRAEPHTNSLILGYMPVDMPIEVIRVVVDGSDLWCQIGLGQYCALRWHGEVYGSFVKEKV